MRRVVLVVPVVPVVLVVLVVAATGCSSERVRPPAPVAEAGWALVAASLSPRLDESSPNVCSRGAPMCLDLVAAEMRDRVDRLVATCDHKAAFALIYLRTTEALRATADAATGSMGPYLRHLDAVFARLYFDAADAWAERRIEAVPAVWRRAYTAADARQITGLGDLLAGMNAHITRDLPFAVDTAGLTLPDGSSAKPAFDAVNATIGELQRPMLAELAQRLDPTIGQADVVQIPGASMTFSQVITTWRDESWINAVRLATAAPSDRPAVAATIEAAADARALTLVTTNQYVPFLSSTTARDDFCRANGRR